MKRLLDYDPSSGIRRYHEYDDITKTTYIHTEQDVQPILERNKLLRNEDNGRGVKQQWWHVGTIPVGLIHKWLKEEGVDVYNPDHWSRVKQKLNSPDYRYLRTSEGRV